MKGLLIQNGDTVRENGKLVVISGKDYYLQRLKITLTIYLGEIIYFPNFGSDWDRILSEGNESILKEVKRIVMSFSETKSIEVLEIKEYIKKERKFIVRLIADTTFGKVEVTL